MEYLASQKDSLHRKMAPTMSVSSDWIGVSCVVNAGGVEVILGETKPREKREIGHVDLKCV